VCGLIIYNMPTSFPEQIPTLLQTINRLQPKTILDIGCGNGKMGHLVKEYFPDIHIDALEVFPKYIKNCHKENYTNITIGNALEVNIPQYDLYLIIDVLEHWQKEPAMDLLRRLTNMGTVLISTPRSVGEQGAEFGNEWERHVSQWLEFEFDEFRAEALPSDFAFIQILNKK